MHFQDELAYLFFLQEKRSEEKVLNYLLNSQFIYLLQVNVIIIYIFISNFSNKLYCKYLLHDFYGSIFFLDY